MKKLSEEHLHVPFLIIWQSFLEIRAFKECHPDMKDPLISNFSNLRSNWHWLDLENWQRYYLVFLALQITFAAAVFVNRRDGNIYKPGGRQHIRQVGRNSEPDLPCCWSKPNAESERTIAFLRQQLFGAMMMIILTDTNCRVSIFSVIWQPKLKRSLFVVTWNNLY